MVVVVAEDVQLALQVGQRSGCRLLGQKALEGLMEALDLAAGLWMVGAGVFGLDAQAGQLELEEHLAAAGAAGEDGGVVAEQGSGQIELAGGGMEGVDDVAGADGGKDAGGQKQARVVVFEVEDLDWAAISQVPGSGVDLPGFVGQLGDEADEGATGALLRLRRDQAVALEDPPDGCGRGWRRETLAEVVEEGLGTPVVTRLDELSAELDDLGFHLRAGLGGAGVRPARARLQGRMAALPRALEQLVDPPTRDAVSPGEFGRAPVFQDNRVDDVATES